MAVAPWIVSDAFWSRVVQVLPTPRRRFRYPGRKRLDDRAALQGILFVLHTGDRVAAYAARARLWLRVDLLPADGRVEAVSDTA